MASFKSANIAIVGAGVIGRRHIQHVREEPQANLVAIVEPTLAGKELASSVGVLCYASVDDLLAARQRNEVEVDAAIVGTPTHTHVQLSIQFMQAIVHVLVEKPVASTAKEGEALMEALKASDGKAKVLVGQHRRLYVRESCQAVKSR
jgi:predicted dehydrogenase